MRAGLERACRTARFVDRLFGGENEYRNEKNPTAARASRSDGTSRTEVNGLRFRASVPPHQRAINAPWPRDAGRIVADSRGGFTPRDQSRDELRRGSGVGYLRTARRQPLRYGCRLN